MKRLEGDARFEKPELWGNLTRSNPDIARKIEVFFEMIPDDVTTIVDVGCGDGAITNRLGARYRVTGVDYSEAALAHVTTDAVRARAQDLPFQPRAFDLALSSQLLEHLGERDYREAVSELLRVARRYVLVSVPFQEQLRQRTIRCPRCGWRGHVWGHRRSFTIQSLLADLTGFEVREVRIFGRIQRPPSPNWLLWVNQNIFGAFYDPRGQVPQCDRCRNSEFPPSRPTKSAIVRVRNIWLRVSRKQPYPFWLAVLAQRSE